MKIALSEAEQAFSENEVPIGAVIVKDSRILGRGHNRTRTLIDPTAHAEILAITAACETLQREHLEGADIYVTMEPCAMCAGAIVLARLKKLYFGVHDAKAGACGSVFDITREPRLNHKVDVHPGIASDKAERFLRDFFSKLRERD